MEKLIEEIEAILYDDVVASPRTKARKAITRILSAVRDGRLDEELGVVGRIDFDPSKMGGFGWKRWGHLINWCEEMSYPLEKRAELFIALSGTGKEEE